MSSTEDELDLERGIPTTPEDVTALRAHRPPPMTWDEYWAFLAAQPQPSSEELAQRPLFRGAPFRLW